ncbi:MAG: PKD domain-containing protein, partial [Dolichospermum sp.]
TNGCKDSISKLVTITTKPLAAFTIPNYNSCSNGGIFNFVNTSVNATSYLWDFGDGAGSTLQTPSHTYTTLGSFTITLIANNTGGCSDTLRQTISLLTKPVATYTVSNTGGCTNTLFSFTSTSTSTSTPSYYYWDFGDGTFSLLQNPSKAFTAPGDYNVILFVTNANGCKDSISKTVNVVSKPTALFTIPNYTSCSGVSSFTFNNTSLNATNYVWDFGDGTGSTIATPTKTYTASGVYVISLIAGNASGCNDTLKQTITLLAKPTASFSVNSNSLCSTNSFVFTNTSTNLSSYYWEFGDGTFSLLQNPIKVYATTGSFRVLLTVTNANGCKDTSSKIVNVFAKPVAGFTVPNTTLCTSNNTIVFTNTSTNATNYIWNFGDGSGSTLINPTKTYATSGTYVITLIANNNNGCNDTVKQTISLFPKPIASFIVNNAGQCLNNNSFTFTNNSLNGVSYLWDFGDGTSSALPNPVKVYTTVGNFNVTLIVTNSNNCTDVTTQSVSVNPTMFASFTISGLSSCALGTTLTFVNNSVGGFNMPTNYWDFGDGTSSNVYSPTKVYTTPGTYTIKYTLVGRFCTDTTSQTITIQAKPTAAFTVSSNATQCLTGNVFSFANNSSGNISTYYWEFGDGSVSASSNPIKSYNAAGTYTVRLTVTNTAGCTDVITRTVVVTGKPIITFDISSNTQCIYNNVFTFTNTSPNQAGTAYYWNFGDGILSTLPVVNKSYVAVGTYSVTLIGTNGAGCIDSLTKTVTLVDKPTPSFTASSYSICANNTIAFTNNTSGSITSTVWKFGDGTSSTNLNPTHTYTNAGVYNVKLIVTNTGGCVDSTMQTIVINPKPTASFTIQGNNQCVGTGSVALTNTSVGIISNYIWDFGDSTGANLANPVKVFTKAGTYNIKLIVKTTNNCVDSVTQTVNIIANPDPTFAFNSVRQCINNNSFNFSSVLAGLNSYIYQWDLGDGTTASTSSVTKSYSSVGSYNVKLVVVNTAFGCRDSVTQVVTVNPQPTATISGSGTICLGNTFVINATLNGTAPFSFTYTDGIKNYFVSGVNTNLYGLSVSPTQTSTYRIVSMSDALCSASTAQLASTSSIVTVDTTRFTKQPSNIVACIGNTITFAPTVNTNTSVNYQWQKNGVNIIGANATSLTLSNISSIDSGTYRLVVMLPCGSIYSSNAVLVVNAPASAPIFTSSVKYCQFDSSKPLVASGNILNWYTTATGGLASQVAPIPSTSIVGTQQYWVSNNTILNCESPRYPITVTVSPKPTVSFIAVGNTEILPTQTVLLKASASTNATGIRWYYNNVPIGSMPLNQSTIGFNNLGKYQVEAITADGCTALSNIINVTAPVGYSQSTQGNNLRLYPNPATAVVNMYFDNPINEDATVRLVTATGQVLQSKVVKFVNKFQPVQMYIANLRADVYTLEVVNSRGISIARNLLIKAR